MIVQILIDRLLPHSPIMVTIASKFCSAIIEEVNFNFSFNFLNIPGYPAIGCLRQLGRVDFLQYSWLCCMQYRVNHIINFFWHSISTFQ